MVKFFYYIYTMSYKNKKRIVKAYLIALAALALTLGSCTKEDSRCIECETMRQVYVNPDPSSPWEWVDDFVIGEQDYCGEDWEGFIDCTEGIEGNEFERFVTTCAEI